jgi:copper chaperone CopZ
MEKKLVLDVPTLWADHHVLKAREALAAVDGVESVTVSSAWKQVLVSYDPELADPEAIEQALVAAGYPVGEGELPVIVEPSESRRDPQWEVLGFRVTETNRADLEMSGEFRRY